MSHEMRQRVSAVTTLGVQVAELSTGLPGSAPVYSVAWKLYPLMTVTALSKVTVLTVFVRETLDNSAF